MSAKYKAIATEKARRRERSLSTSFEGITLAEAAALNEEGEGEGEEAGSNIDSDSDRENGSSGNSSFTPVGKQQGGKEAAFEVGTSPTSVLNAWQIDAV
jgi:hypothetical protein